MDIELIGKSSDPVYQKLFIELERCSGDNCKSDAEIDAFFEASNFVFVYNKQVYNTNHYNETTIESERDFFKTKRGGGNTSITLQKNTLESDDSLLGLSFDAKDYEYYTTTFERT